MLEAAVTVVCRDSFAASLFVAEHQVDPPVEVLRHKLTLESRAVFLEEITEICRRQTEQMSFDLTDRAATETKSFL